MKLIWKAITYSNGIKWRALVATLGTILFKLLDMTPGILIGIIIDVVVHGQNGFTGSFVSSDKPSLVKLLAFAMVGAWIVSALFQYLASLAWKSAARHLQHDLRLDLYRHIQQLPLSTINRSGVAQLFEVLSSDINQIESFINRSLDEAVQIVVSIVLLWAIVIYIDIRFLWCVTLPIPILILFIWQYRKKIEPHFRYALTKMIGLSNGIHSHLMGLLDIKSLGQEDWSLKKVTSLSDSLQVASLPAAVRVSTLLPATKLIIICGIVSVLLYGGGMVIDHRVNTGVFTSIFFLTQRYLWPLGGLVRIADAYSKCLNSLQRIESIRRESVQTSGEEGGVLALPIDSVRLKNVSFGYSNKNVLNKLNAEFLAGQITAIQGPSGCGKTTLSHCLLRLYDVSEGSVQFGESSIQNIPLRALRRLIGYVPQSPKLIAASLIENIAFGDPNPDEHKIERLLKSLGMTDFIEKLHLPVDISTLDSVKLSGGELQRIAIVRALYRDSQILIFDEATSGLDTEVELKLLEYLGRRKSERVVIFISHRDSIRQFADRVYQFQTGGGFVHVS